MHDRNKMFQIKTSGNAMMKTKNFIAASNL